jgi:hypothetical protein
VCEREIGIEIKRWRKRSGRGAFRERETYQAAIRSLGQLCLHSESGIDDEPVPRRSLRDRGRE